ncbi:MAG: serine/threonine-protein kinase [Kofleriaceae bacterium]
MIESTRVVGNYTLGSLIGRGGTSEVYAAEHRFLGEAVAVKLLRSHLIGDAAASAAFVAEAVKTRAVVHPNVVQVLDAGADESTGSCYLVMEHVAGESLAARLKRVRALDEREARRMVAAICRGMQAVHDRGIVHRDLKPGNVMLSDDQPKIVDFGIARELGDEVAITTTTRVGTPAYMAPEQLTGGLIAPCVDVWALGVILFEVVTGSLPFERFADGRCPQLFEIAPRARSRATISAQLDDLIARCLDRDPGRRPRSMAAIADVLEGESEERVTQDVGEVGGVGNVVAPISSRRSVPSPRKRARRRALVFAGAVVIAAAIGGVAALMWPVDKPLVARAPATPEVGPRIGPQLEPEVEPEVEPRPERETKPAPDIARITPPRPHTSGRSRPVIASFSVLVRSTPPGATILIDGKARGVTPERIKLRASTSVLLRRAGYHDARMRVTRANQSAPVTVRLIETLN